MKTMTQAQIDALNGQAAKTNTAEKTNTSKHWEKNGVTRPYQEGFSWTTLFFGFLVPLCRNDWGSFGLYLVLGIIVGIIGSPLLFIPSLILWIWQGCTYNNRYNEFMRLNDWQLVEK